MTIKITYSKKASSRQQFNLVLFVDEKLNINNLKKHLSANEFKYVSEISKSSDTKKNIFIYEINSKNKIILIKNKKDIKTSEIENLGAEFYKIIKDRKLNECSINSDSIFNSKSNFLEYFLHGIKLKSYEFNKYKTKKNIQKRFKFLL